MKQKNIILAGVALIILLLLGVGGFMVLNKDKSATSDDSSNTSEDNENVITSIRDALSKSMTLECNYDDSESGTKVQAYIKNGAVRTNITAKDPKSSGSTIIKDKKMYFWNQDGGFMMEIPEISITPTEDDSSSQNSNPEDVIEGIERYKDSCKPAVVSDSLFTPPTDVKFQDFSQMMKMMAPSGAKTSPAMDQKQIEDLMKQYQDR